jgi:hypothetical protein
MLCVPPAVETTTGLAAEASLERCPINPRKPKPPLSGKMHRVAAGDLPVNSVKQILGFGERIE